MAYRLRPWAVHSERPGWVPGRALWRCCLPGRCGRARIVPSPLNVRDPSSPSFGHGRGEGSGAVSPVAMVWPCPLPVGAYAAAGRGVGFPRPGCPSCFGHTISEANHRPSSPVLLLAIGSTRSFLAAVPQRAEHVPFCRCYSGVDHAAHPDLCYLRVGFTRLAGHAGVGGS